MQLRCKVLLRQIVVILQWPPKGVWEENAGPPIGPTRSIKSSTPTLFENSDDSWFLALNPNSDPNPANKALNPDSNPNPDSHITGQNHKWKYLRQARVLHIIVGRMTSQTWFPSIFGIKCYCRIYLQDRNLQTEFGESLLSISGAHKVKMIASLELC